MDESAPTAGNAQLMQAIMHESEQVQSGIEREQNGVIRRRLLVNFRIDPAVVQRLLPAPFRWETAGELYL